jgi:hypothetical protein
MAGGGMKVKVSVTAEDIANGVQHDSMACPIYWAAERALPWVDEVGSWNIHLCVSPETDEEWCIPIDLPVEAQGFISRFDSEGPAAVKPFEFEVEFPDEFTVTA